VLEETNLYDSSPNSCFSPAESSSSLAGGQSAQRSLLSLSPALLEDMQFPGVEVLDLWRIVDLLQLGGVPELWQQLVRLFPIPRETNYPNQLLDKISTS